MSHECNEVNKKHESGNEEVLIWSWIHDIYIKIQFKPQKIFLKLKMSLQILPDERYRYQN